MKPFRVIGPLDEGAIGELWEAVEQLPFDQQEPRVIKQLPVEHRGDPRYWERFNHEAITALRYGHRRRNLVTAFAYESTADGGPYFLMEHVRGPRLWDVMEQLRDDFPVVANIAHGMLDALRFLHECNHLHRDVSPTNILLADDGDPRLIDFGLAQLIDSPSTDAFRGHHYYLSPARLHGHPATPLDDVFALGAVIYEVLTGLPPFGEGDPIQLRDNWKDAEYQLPDAVPDEFAELVLYMIARSPDHRIPMDEAFDFLDLRRRELCASSKRMRELSRAWLSGRKSRKKPEETPKGVHDAVFQFADREAAVRLLAAGGTPGVIAPGPALDGPSPVALLRPGAAEMPLGVTRDVPGASLGEDRPSDGQAALASFSQAESDRPAEPKTGAEVNGSKSTDKPAESAQPQQRRIVWPVLAALAVGLLLGVQTQRLWPDADPPVHANIQESEPRLSTATTHDPARTTNKPSDGKPALTTIIEVTVPEFNTASRVRIESRPAEAPVLADTDDIEIDHGETGLKALWAGLGGEKKAAVEVSEFKELFYQRTEPGDDDVLLSIERGIRTRSYLYLYGHLYNGDFTEFQVAFYATDGHSKTNLVGLGRLSSDKHSECEQSGIVPSRSRCDIFVWLRGMDQTIGSVVDLTISESKGPRQVSIRGLSTR